MRTVHAFLVPPLLALLAFGCVPGSVVGGPSSPDGATREGLVRLPDGSVTRLRYTEADGYAILWGDVIVGRPVELEDPGTDVGSGRGALADDLDPPGRRWPGGVVPYEIAPGLPDRARVDQAIAHYAEHTPIRLVPRDGQEDYVMFAPGSGCWSYVGRIGGEQEIVLEDGCDFSAVVHEIGHAIGLVHEHQRPDRDEHVTIHWDRLEDGAAPYFETTDARVDTPYDVQSRMHYHATAFSGRCDAEGRNCEPTITLRDGRVYESNRGGLSALDIEGVRGLYATDLATDGCAAVARVAGADRFATAVAINDAFGVDSDVALVVSGVGGGVVDALSAGPYAHVIGAPLVLTAPTVLPDATAEGLRRWGTQIVYVMGGPGAVSDEVVRALEALPAVRRVERIAGASRFATAAAVAERMNLSDTAFIVSGEDRAVPDALAAAGPAGQLAAPILLVTQDTVPQETREALRRLGVTRTWVVGGTGVISDAVLRELPSPRRLAGASRFETAASVARILADEERIDTSHIFLVRHDPIVDALAAGARGYPVLYSTTDSLPGTTASALGELAGAASLLGGPRALSERVRAQACDALR